SFLASVIARSSLGLIEPRCFPKGIESASAESRAAGALLERHRVTKRPRVGHRARSRTRPSVLGYAPLAHSAAGLGFARRAHPSASLNLGAFPKVSSRPPQNRAPPALRVLASPGALICPDRPTPSARS